jgi:CheY-like chemotaxis protein
MPFPPSSPFPQTEPDRASRLPLQGLMLLVVDDSRFACDALRLILSRAGARMRRAESLEIARLHVGCYRPDLAIVDLGLPDGRGEDLIAELAAQRVPVLGLSGDPDGRDRADETGATAFLEKPVGSVAGLVRMIRQLVAGAGPEALAKDVPTPQADPGALRDDLRLAADLVQTRGDPAYALSFLHGLARASRDPALEQAVRGATTPFDRARLVQMVEDRLSVLRGIG